VSAPTSDPVDDPTVHELLLALAGRLDDDLLAWARELVAVGEEGQAVELATAALAAERVALPPALRAAAVAAARAAHTDLNVERELAPAVSDDANGHRFDAAVAPADRVAAVLAALPARRLAGCTFHLTWRLTPAGTAPGPVPRALLLVEAGPDRSADVLAYLLATELDRAGLPTSVEVFTTGAVLPAYHVAALRSARRIEVGATVIAPAGVVVARTVAERAETPVAGPPDVAARVPGRPDAEAGTRADTAALFVVPSPDDALSGSSAESRRAGGRRRRRDLGGSVIEEPPGVDAGAVDADVAGAPDAEGAPDTDPFHGPLRVPLLAPLLDPTTPGADDGSARPPQPTPIRPLPAQPAAADRDEPAGGKAHSVESDTSRIELLPTASEPAAPADEPPSEAVGGADEIPQEWEDDWRSGDWAMPPSGLSGPPAEVPAESPAAPVDEAPPAESFDIFDTSAPPAPVGTGAGESDVEKTGRTAVRRTEVRADVDPGPRRRPPADQHPDVSLFDSPTARVGRPPRPGSPVRPPSAEMPRRSPPPDVPLFGDAPSPDGRRPDAAPSDLPREGRRRRPEPEEPEPAAPPAAPDADSPLLAGTERDLLAQLQAELASQERRPRPYRRAARTDVTPAVNGHGANGHGINGHGDGANGQPGGHTPPSPDAAG
jgi:hypothetical protein